MKRLPWLAAFALLCASPVAAQMYGLASVTATGVSSLLAKSLPGNQYSVYATNYTATAGFLVGYNATSVPADGALTGSLIVECVPLPANGTASINDQPGPTTNYSAGMVYILTSAATCATKTSGTLLGFISAKIQ